MMGKPTVVVPYKDDQAGKKQQVEQMFNTISGSYDFLNHLLSLGIDKRWRKKAIAMLRENQPKTILDVATGTGDLAIRAASLNPDRVVGVDISEGMLEIGRKKIKKKGLDHLIELVKGDSENMPFPDAHFEAVMVAFGVRNFENLQQGLKEIRRVLKPGGKLLVLEFSKPRNRLLYGAYKLYFEWIVPRIGTLVSKDKAAYTYLPESVKAFPVGNEFLNILASIGYNQTKCIPLTSGISSIYTATK